MSNLQEGRGFTFKQPSSQNLDSPGQIFLFKEELVVDKEKRKGKK